MLDNLLHPILGLHGLPAYLVICALCFGEAAFLLGFFLPGETAVIFGGVLAYEHRVSLPLILVLVIIAAIAGDSVGYLVGRHLGPRMLDTRVMRGRSAVARSRDFVQRRGAYAVFFGRFVAVFRTLVPGVAGMSSVRYRTFLAANAVGGIVWGATYTMLGYAFGASYEAVVRVAGKASAIFVAVVVVGFLAFSARKRWREHRELVASRAAMDEVEQSGQDQAISSGQPEAVQADLPEPPHERYTMPDDESRPA